MTTAAGDPRSDRDLVAAIAGAGDEGSFRVLYRRHAPAMFALAVRLTGSRSDAEDALQEAWLRATGALNGFGWRSSLRTWLCGYVLNCAREQVRQRGSGPAVRAGETTTDRQESPPSPSPNPAAVLDLEKAVAALAPGHREVLVLHDVMGFTHEEIAAILDVEPGTSKSQLFRARSILRLRLGGDTAAGGSKR